VSRERVGGEVDLMLRSPDPVGAMRLLVNLQLADTVFPIHKYLADDLKGKGGGNENGMAQLTAARFFQKGLELLSTAHDHLADCRLSPPLWCVRSRPIWGAEEVRLTEDSEARRLLWYAAFLKPLNDYGRRRAAASAGKVGRREGRKGHRSLIARLLVDDLKRPIRDAEAVERILKAADEFTHLLNSGCEISAMMILLSDVRVMYDERPAEHHQDQHQQPQINGDTSTAGAVPVDGEQRGWLSCSMNGRVVDSATEEDPVWEHAMEFRLLCSNVMRRIGPLWRAALFLSISEQLAALEDDGTYLEYAIAGDVVDESQEEKRHGVVERFDAFATALQQVGLIGIWDEKPLLDGGAVKQVLPKIPRGPAFRDVMDEQRSYMAAHPGANMESVIRHLRTVFVEYTAEHHQGAEEGKKDKSKKQSRK